MVEFLELFGGLTLIFTIFHVNVRNGIDFMGFKMVLGRFRAERMRELERKENGSQKN